MQAVCVCHVCRCVAVSPGRLRIVSCEVVFKAVAALREWPSDTGCQYRALVGKLFKIGIPKFRETCRLAAAAARFVSQRKFGNGPCIYAGIELSTVA